MRNQKDAQATKQSEDEKYYEYRQNLMHIVLDYLDKSETSEVWLSTFFYDVDATERESSQKKMKEFLESEMSDMVEVYPSEGRHSGQYTTRLRVENADKFTQNEDEDDDEEEQPPRKRHGRQDSRSRKRHHAPNTAPPTAAGWRMKLHVGYLHWDTTDKDLKEFFDQVGAIYSAKAIYEQHNPRNSRGWAIVEYYSNRDARAAINELHDGRLDGQKIRVREFNECKPRTQRGHEFFGCARYG